MACYGQDFLDLPNYIENNGFKKEGVFLHSIEKFRWVSIDHWKNEPPVVNFTADYIEVITNNHHHNQRVKLYVGFGLGYDTPDLTTGAGKFWVSSDTNPTKNRCIVLLQGRTLCRFSQVNVVFGNQLDGKGWPSIKIYSSKFFVYF